MPGTARGISGSRWAAHTRLHAIRTVSRPRAVGPPAGNASDFGGGKKNPPAPFRKVGDWGVFSWFSGVQEGHLFGKSGEFQPPMEFARNVGSAVFVLWELGRSENMEGGGISIVYGGKPPY